MKILNTNSLRVKQLEKNKYLTWTTSLYIISVPKVIFELNEKGNEKTITTIEFTRSILLNSLFSFGVILLTFYFKEGKFIPIDLLIKLLIGILTFLFLVNFILIETIKRLVRKQLK